LCWRQRLSATGFYESDEEGDDESAVVILDEYWAPPPPKSGKWTKETYSQRWFNWIFVWEEGEKNYLSVCAEDPYPNSNLKKQLAKAGGKFAEANPFYMPAIKKWRESGHEKPAPPKQGDKRSRAPRQTPRQ
jgi:hypothetical protein